MLILLCKVSQQIEVRFASQMLARIVIASTATNLIQQMSHGEQPILEPAPWTLQSSRLHKWPRPFAQHR
jgi:hypothetical protein